jgi:predicted dehydrogenase
MNRMSGRRTFLQVSGAAALEKVWNLNPRALGANERVTLGLIGGRAQGRAVALRAIQAGAQVKTFCDLDPAVQNRTGADLEKAQNRKPELETLFERVLEDKEIDAVIIGVPDHWHSRIAILACQAGKDVYCEKPLCQTIQEGRRIRNAARKYNRVFQVGTQRRSGEHIRSAVELAASGKLGKIPLIKAWVNQIRIDIGNPPDSNPPPGVDYDRWLGNAPQRPFNENRFHYLWRWFWDYGNSELGNQGVHVLDVALWGIQLMRGFEPRQCMPRRVSATGGIYWLKDAKEVPDTQIVNYDYGDMLLSWELRSFATDFTAPHSSAPVATSKFTGGPAGFWTGFFGAEATLIVTESRWDLYWKDGKVETTKGNGFRHEANFLECVKSRQRPNSDVEIGRLSTMLCHLGNISQRLGRDVVFDPANENFGSDQAANRMLTKAYRAPYGLPEL